MALGCFYVATRPSRRHLAMAFHRVSVCLLLHVLSVVNGRTDGIRGKHLIASTGNFPPSISIRRNSSGHVVGYNGHVYQQFDWLSKRLRFSYDMIQPKQNTYGQKVNGSWDGLIGQLVRKEVDVAIGPFGVSFQRYEAMNFAGLIGGTGITLLIKYPESQSSYWAVLQPFSYPVWVAFMSSTVCVLVAVYVVWRSSQTPVGQSQSHLAGSKFADLVLYLWGTLTAQGGYYRMSGSSISFVTGSWCLLAFVFVNVYSSTLTSFFSVRYKAPEVNSLVQLAESGTQQITTLKGSVTELALMNPSSSVMKALGEKYQKCSPCKVNSVDEAGHRVLEGPYNAFLPTLWCYGFMQSNYVATQKCLLTVANMEYGWQHVYFGVPKSSPYIEEINHGALWAEAMGLNDKWKRSLLYPRQCILRYNNKGVSVVRSNFPVKLNQLYGAFLLLFAGCSLAGAQFVRERIFPPTA